MNKGMTVFPRECYSCGEKMTVAEHNRYLLECTFCDITEDATVTGRYTTFTLTAYQWNGESIPFLDHGKLNCPSPDCLG